jgi:ATP-dependent helicase HrpA
MSTRQENKKMENQSLPIAGFKSVIMDAVKGNPVTIITAETGAGKSTQVPQYLLEEGCDIVVTQPRRLAARTVAERVAYEYGCELGETVGFRTAYERADSPATRCLFVTDGLALVRELMGAGRHQILVLDEVHEWNLNLEVLVAWVRKRLAEGANFKVVLMSATLEDEKLSNFFGGAPIISVPGRLFPVTDEKPQGRELVMDVERLLRAGRNVLVFQPGKREIGETISALENLQKTSGLNAEILPLHGELESSDQRKCFAHYARPKVVVSTNVAQTSVTIDDIDAVVDSGMERRIEVVDGVEGLYLKPISVADSSQRKGRAGRCKPGIYIDWCASSDRLEFPKAEILRSRLDQTVLRLAEAGFDMEELEFFHQPAKTEIHDAKRALHALGCLGQNGTATKIGHQVAKLPVSVQFGRMLVEADRLGVVDDVLTAAAILEQGDITMRPRDKYEEPAWRKLCMGEETSDILAQLTVWKQAERMNKGQMLDNGVFAKAYFQAKEKRRHLADALRGKVREFRSSGKRDDILRAVCAGMVDHLYQRQYGSWKNGDGQERELAKESVVRGGDWLVGMPFDLQIKTKRGGMMTLRLVRMATKVDPTWLVEIAPQLVKIETGLSPAYDPNQDVCVSTARTNFNGQVVKEDRVQTPEHEAASQELAKWIASQMV